jgi:hypothetical protein
MEVSGSTLPASGVRRHLGGPARPEAPTRRQQPSAYVLRQTSKAYLVFDQLRRNRGEHTVANVSRALAQLTEASSLPLGRLGIRDFRVYRTKKSL